MGIANLPDQILEAKFDLYQNGSQVTGFPIEIKISSQNISTFPVFWDSSSDVSLGGTKRSNIRGHDLSVTLDYGASLEPTKMKNLLDSLPNLSSNEYELRFYPNANVNEYIEMIPQEGTGLDIEFNDTVRVGGADSVIPTIQLESRSYQDNLDAFFN